MVGARHSLFHGIHSHCNALGPVIAVVFECNHAML